MRDALVMSLFSDKSIHVSPLTALVLLVTKVVFNSVGVCMCLGCNSSRSLTISTHCHVKSYGVLSTFLSNFTLDVMVEYAFGLTGCPCVKKLPGGLLADVVLLSDDAIKLQWLLDRLSESYIMLGIRFAQSE